MLLASFYGSAREAGVARVLLCHVPRHNLKSLSHTLYADLTRLRSFIGM